MVQDGIDVVVAATFAQVAAREDVVVVDLLASITSRVSGAAGVEVAWPLASA